MGEEPVVGAHEAVPVGTEGQGRPGRADAGIHNGEVRGAGRKARPGAAEQVGAGPDVARRDGVGDVDEDGSGAEAEQHALHFSHVGIRGAEVGEQRDQRHAQR